MSRLRKRSETAGETRPAPVRRQLQSAGSLDPGDGRVGCDRAQSLNPCVDHRCNRALREPVLVDREQQLLQPGDSFDHLLA